ncbi:hypothetical protein [Arthrobacter sp. Z4-13]
MTGGTKLERHPQEPDQQQHHGQVEYELQDRKAYEVAHAELQHRGGQRRGPAGRGKMNAVRSQEPLPKESATDCGEAPMARAVTAMMTTPVRREPVHPC